MMNKIGILAALLIVPIALQAIVYLFDGVAGDRSILLTLVSLPCAAWVLGSFFAHRFWLIAAFCGALFPYIYLEVDRLFIYWYRMDFLENAANYSARGSFVLLFFAVLLLIPLCAFLAAKAARRNRVEESNEN